MISFEVELIEAEQKYDQLYDTRNIHYHEIQFMRADSHCIEFSTRIDREGEP